MNFVLNKLTRITSSGLYIPAIDGLRFLAIISVLIYHFHGFILANTLNNYSDKISDYTMLNFYIENANIGVQLFFVLSGFVLAIPFANQWINNEKAVNLKKFYLRRLTRLEPPYIICLVLFFLSLVFIVKKYSFIGLLPSFLASLFYVHNIFYPEALPLINCVTWSLEIEVQFYLIAPFIARIFIFSPTSRRLVLLGIIFLMPLIQFYYPSKINFIYSHIQYFLTGFLLADFYVSKQWLNVGQFLSLLLGIAIVICLFSLHQYDLKSKYILPVAIFLLYFMVLNPNNVWNKIFSIKIITVIGGMCYSIYLLHFVLISIIGKKVIAIEFTKWLIVDWFFQLILINGAVLIISSFYFYYVERWFMKDWFKINTISSPK